MRTKSRPRETNFVPGTSRNRENVVTLLRVARDRAQLLEMGARIAELRSASGLRQQAVADYCGVELRSYQFWQQGKHPPTGVALEKLAELFNVTPQYILRGTTPEPLGGMESKDKLDRIESKLDEIQRQLDDIAELTTGAQVAQAVHEAFQDYANRLEPETSKRPPISRRTTGPRRPSSRGTAPNSRP